jgi:hypothetical protein
MRGGGVVGGGIGSVQVGCVPCAVACPVVVRGKEVSVSGLGAVTCCTILQLSFVSGHTRVPSHEQGVSGNGCHVAAVIVQRLGRWDTAISVHLP